MTEAWLRAREVVGLYGDPTVPWSIVLEASLSRPLAPGAVAARLAALADRYPHLGGAPTVVTDGSAAQVREDFAGRVYDGDPSLVRVAVLGEVLLLAAHHGAVDGLGLLALLGAAVDRPVRTGVVGMRDRPIAPSFAATAVRSPAMRRHSPRPAPSSGHGRMRASRRCSAPSPTCRSSMRKAWPCRTRQYACSRNWWRKRPS